MTTFTAIIKVTVSAMIIVGMLILRSHDIDNNNDNFNEIKTMMRRATKLLLIITTTINCHRTNTFSVRARIVSILSS